MDGGCCTYTNKASCADGYTVEWQSLFPQWWRTATSSEKSCAYGSTEAYCSQLKPLKKVTLARAAVL
jgi:hypothetical protein